jgi:flagellar motor switch protein FliN/FliY
MATPQERIGALIEALAGEVANSMGALLGASGTAAATAGDPEIGWTVRAEVSGPTTGSIVLGFTRADGSRLAKVVMGFDDDPDDAAVIDMLQEVANQAFGALGQHPLAEGAKFKAESAVAGSGGDQTVDRHLFALTLDSDFTPTIACWADLPVAAAVAAPPLSVVGAGAAPAPQAKRASDSIAAAGRSYPNLDVILDIDLPLSVRFGETEMTLDALTRIGPGSVIDLGRSPDDPVDILVNGRLVARGEVVVVAGNYGVRVHEVVSAADRLRSMAS